MFADGAAAAVVTSMVIGGALGLIAGYSNRWYSQVILRLADIIMSFPSLLLAVVVLYVFSPSAANIVAVLALTRIPVYLRTARAKGLAPRLIRDRFIMRNALLPVSTTLGLQLGLLISGAVLTETVFAFNGIGRFLAQAIFQLDFPVLQGFIIFIALIYSLINLVVDVSYGLIDPRVRVS